MMLSTSPIKNVAKAGHYYNQKDNYYTRDKGIEQSEWWGREKWREKPVKHFSRHGLPPLLL